MVSSGLQTNDRECDVTVGGQVSVDEHSVASTQHSALRYEQLWQAALGDLQSQVSRANYETWLRSTSLVGVSGETATVASPNAFAVDQLRHKFDR